MTKKEKRVIVKGLANINNNAFFAFYSVDENDKKELLIKICKNVANLLSFLK